MIDKNTSVLLGKFTIFLASAFNVVIRKSNLLFLQHPTIILSIVSLSYGESLIRSNSVIQFKAYPLKVSCKVTFILGAADKISFISSDSRTLLVEDNILTTFLIYLSIYVLLDAKTSYNVHKIRRVFKIVQRR